MSKNIFTYIVVDGFYKLDNPLFRFQFSHSPPQDTALHANESLVYVYKNIVCIFLFFFMYLSCNLQNRKMALVVLLPDMSPNHISSIETSLMMLSMCSRTFMTCSCNFKHLQFLLNRVPPFSLKRLMICERYHSIGTTLSCTV